MYYIKYCHFSFDDFLSNFNLESFKTVIGIVHKETISNYECGTGFSEINVVKCRRLVFSLT